MQPKQLIILIAAGVIFLPAPFAAPAAVSGIVVDQNGSPTAGAVVHAVAENPSPSADGPQKLTAVTDEQGNFNLSAPGGSLRITSIKKEGYYLLGKQAERANFHLSSGSGISQSQGQKPEPIVLKMHKSSGPAYLLCSQSRFTVEAAKPADVLLNMQTGSNITKASKSIEGGSQTAQEVPLPGGLKIQSEADRKKGLYSLILTCPDDGSGIVVSDEYCYEAPSDGYQAASTIQIPYSAQKAGECARYLYVKTKGQQDGQWQYSRMELNITIGKAALIADVICQTNPSGSRNLEFDEKFQQARQAELMNQYREALEKGSLSDEEMSKLRQMSMQGAMQDHRRRWDFDPARRRAMEEKRLKQRQAEGRTDLKKNQK